MPTPPPHFRPARTIGRSERRGIDDTTSARRTELPSGLRVVSEHVPGVRSLAIGVWINVGSRDEDPAVAGIAHFIEHAVFKGTTTRKTHQIAQYLEAVGGYVNAFTGKDSTCYYARILDRHLPRAVDLLADLVCNPAFRAQEIEREKLVIAEEMRSIEDDPEDIINDHFEQRVFGSHPLGVPVIGSADTVAALTPDALHRFIRERYCAENIVVAAAGAVDHEQLLALAARAFERLPHGAPPARTRPRARKASTTSIAKPVQQVHAVMGRAVPGVTHRDSAAISILNTLLGDGMSSRLFQRVRERHGYAYNIYSFASLYDDAGIFGIYFSADDRNVDRCRSIIRRELDDLRFSPISAREMNRAREQLIGGMLISLESMSSRMTRIAKDEIVFGRPIPIDEQIGKILDVTPDRLLQVASFSCDHQTYTAVDIVPSGETSDSE